MTPPYIVTALDHTPLTTRLNSIRLVTPLRITPEPSQSRGFRASATGGCLRRVGYRLLHVPELDDVHNPDYALRADMGTAIHVRIQEQAVQSGLVAHFHGLPAIEVVLADYCDAAHRAQLEHWNFSGHIDAILITKQGTLSVLDIKSSDPKYFTTGYRRWLDKKTQGYCSQLSAYMYAFAAPDGRKATDAFIYYINRGAPEQRMLFHVPWQPARWQVDADRIERAVTALASNNLPEPEGALGPCVFCAWQSLCPGSTARKHTKRTDQLAAAAIY